MQTILVAGAGKSSTFLINYLLSHAPANKWKILVADGSQDAILQKTKNNPFSESAPVDITNKSERQRLVKKSDIVVSLMPPQLHILLAKDCLEFKKNLITSSYISPEMKEMDAAVKAADLMFMCEMGLDPGIDHMTASQIIHSIQRVAASITSFESFCGGLIAPESDNNPWHYKFTWNPKNVITAGQGGSSFLQNGKNVSIPYEKTFENNKKVKVDGYGTFSYYPNRDSLRYLDLYDVPEVNTFLRATLRQPDFCKGWQAVVALDLTNEQETLKGFSTYAEWLKFKTGWQGVVSLKDHVAQKLQTPSKEKVLGMLEWLGIFEENPILTQRDNSASILLDLLLEKWAMKPEDKDMVVMQHEVEYMHRNKASRLVSSMVVKGEDREHSAMAKTVGLPMGILARGIINRKINAPKGVLIPNMASVYKPVLSELKHHGIQFRETVV